MENKLLPMVICKVNPKINVNFTANVPDFWMTYRKPLMLLLCVLCDIPIKSIKGE